MSGKGITVKTIFIFWGVIWAAIAVLVIPRVYGPEINPDEFGYWAHAAYLAGLDWHEAAASFSYYSFGYGLLIYSFFMMIKNPVALYRTMVGINFLLVWGSSLLIYALLGKLFPQVERKRIAAVSGAAMLYVAYITYAQVTLSEIVLVFLYVLLAYAVYSWCSKITMRKTAAVLAVGGYMYAVHMRTFGILLVTGGCMLFFTLGQAAGKQKTKVILLILLSIAAAFIIVAAVREEWISGGAPVYRDLAGKNSYSGKIGQLKYLLSWEGIRNLLLGTMGKVFYLGCASLGFYFWGMGHLLGRVSAALREFRDKRRLSAGAMISVWLFLSHLSALMITAVSLNSSGGRMDGILYGRYHENTIPVILALGIYSLAEKAETARKAIAYICIQSVSFLAVYYLLVQRGQFTTLAKHSITGVMYAVIFGDYYDNLLLVYAFFGGLAGCLILCGIRKISSSRWMPLCAAACALQLILAGFSARYLTMLAVPRQQGDSEALIQVAEQTAGQTGIYLQDGTEQLICMAQFTLRRPLRVIPLEEWEGEDAPADVFLIMHRTTEDKLEEQLAGQYTDCIRSPSYTIYYNPTGQAVSGERKGF